MHCATIGFRLAVETAGDTLRKEGRVVVRGVRFDTGSAEINDESEMVLRDLLSVLAERLQAEGFGEGRPVATNASETGRALNRRVEISALK
jgi:outer membrane protein OmpA-like peptidoglycan-associated protein